MKGWVCSHRRKWGHHLFKGNAERAGVWDWLICAAAWKDDTPFDVHGHTIRLKRGQLCVSQRQIEAETGMGRTALRTFLRELEATQSLTRTPTQVATHKRTIITICNYDKYQAEKSEPTQVPNTNQPRNQPINKQDKTNKQTSEEGAAAPPIEVKFSTSILWSAGKQFLNSRGVERPGRFIGKWLKDHTEREIMEAIDAAQKAGTQDPVPYIEAALKPGHERSEGEVIKFWADWINSDKKLFSAPSREITEKIAASGLVDPVRLRERVG